jgi:hypothetical protein
VLFSLTGKAVIRRAITKVKKQIGSLYSKQKLAPESGSTAREAVKPRREKPYYK